MEFLYVPPPESIFIEVSGATLLGRFYRAPDPGRHPTVIDFPGMPGSHLDSGTLGYAMRSLGWNVLTFQYRGLWGSSGEPFTSVAQVTEDIAAVIEFALRDDSVDPERLALRGYSTGGWLAGSYAAVDQRIRTIVLLSPLVRLRARGALIEAIQTGSERAKPWVLAMGGADVAVRTVTRLGESVGHTWLPLAPKLSDRRVLILSGDRDEVIPLAATQELSDAIQSAKWIRHPEADHNWTGRGQWLVTQIAEWLTAAP